MLQEIADIIAENKRRNEVINTPFNPITGLNSIGERECVSIEDFPIKQMWLPVEMLRVKLIKLIIKYGIRGFIEDVLHAEYNEMEREKVINQFTRIRYKYDFAFWAAMIVYIKNKGGGDDVLFVLTRPQRKFVTKLEQMRKARLPIRIVLLKARQWGGSTTSQIYMAWLQLIHQKGLNSLIIAHQGSGSDEIKSMFDRMISRYPIEMLYKIGEAYNPATTKMANVGKSGSIYRVPQRNCNIKVGTAERPDSCRGGDYNLVHLSEVGLWRTTEGKKPEDIVRSACSGVLLKPYTMIVYESTANGSGNFFQYEYDAAKAHESQFDALFISWFDIDTYSAPIDDIEAFATRLYENRYVESVNNHREEPGRYLWWLWEKGATLEAINWYIEERRGKNSHEVMASEFPSDDVEAFVNSGSRVFDQYQVLKFQPSCKPPKHVGDVYADADEGKDALKNVRFGYDRQGFFNVWDMPEKEDDDGEIVTDRYLTVVDIGGRSNKADWSVIVVFDRMFMVDGGKPMVVAQWYGHCDIDRLAWRAAQIASFYNNSLLVIESNTLETHDRERQVDGDQSQFILNQIKNIYPNLYARKQSEDDILNGVPRKYGFHTNVSTKPMIISTLVKVIREQLYIERDARCVDEYLTYERKQNGAYGAIIGKHDDLLMTRAIGLHICFFEMPTPKIISAKDRKFHTKKKTISEATI